MKKIFALFACAAIVLASLAGCGYQDALSNRNTTSETTATADEQPTEADVDSSSYSDNFDGLIKYFNALGYIDSSANTTIDMDASLIGAKEGKKFTKDNIQIELYYYDTKKLDDTGEDVINSVKKNGTFTILGLPKVKAYLSDSGKYLMIYNDPSIDKNNPDKGSESYKKQETVVENFKNFKK